jgi:hypothetical protein
MSGVSLSGCTTGVSAAASGPDAWYYACTDTPTSEPSYGTSAGFSSGQFKCVSITLPAGTVTKFSVYANEDYNEKHKMALYDGSRNLVAGDGTEVTFLGYDPDTGWRDITLGTPTVIGAGTYNLCGIMNISSSGCVKANTYTSHGYASQTYASWPAATHDAFSTDTNCYAYRIYLD